MTKKQPSLLYGLLTALGLIVTTLAVARAAGWLGVTERLSVTLATAERRDMEAVVSTHGYVQAAQVVTIRSELPGQVQSLPVAEGDTVGAGQLLAVIRPSGVAAQLDNAQAQVDRQRSLWADDQAQADRARVLRQQAEAVYQRNKFLHQQGVIADVAWEEAQAQYRTVRQEEHIAIQQAQAAYHAVQAAQADRQQAQQRRDLSRIYAPQRGTVLGLSVTEGERVVGTGVQEGTALLHLANLNRWEVHFTIGEAELLQVKPGQAARVRLEALPGQPLPGVVSHVAYGAVGGGAPGESTYAVRVALDSVPLSLRIGMTATVDVATQTKAQTLVVPLLAASPRPNPEAVAEADSLQDVLFVYRRGRVEQRTVELGIHNREYIEVLSGLEAGETVVSGPYQAVFHQLRDGALVQSRNNHNDPSQTFAGGP